MRTPEIIIKVNYKGKRISIPIATVDDKSLHETVMPHIVRFERDILRTPALTQTIPTSAPPASSTGRPPGGEMSSRTTISKLANPSVSSRGSCSR